MSQFKPRDVVTYHAANGWCRHGIAVIHGGDGWGYAKDTYWGVSDAGGDSGWIREQDLAEPTLIGNLDDFEYSKYAEFKDYREEDKFYIPMGGGSAQQWIRKGAEPDPALIWKRLVYQVEKAEMEIQYAQHTREWKVKELNEHIAKHGIPDNGMEDIGEALLHSSVSA
jgi:hypothetical protein